MNYQPFLDMHVLLSDDLLSVLAQTKDAVAWIALCIVLLLALYWVVKHRLI